MANKRRTPHKRVAISFARACVGYVSAFVLTFQPVAAHALPAGGVVSAGSASISQTATTVTVNQSSTRAVVDWNSFNVGSTESVSFNQPSASAIALNRIHDANPSLINGTINANGRVWLINQNGMVFGSSAQVNVGGLLATTADISNADFMGGDIVKIHFACDSCSLC